MCIHAAQVDTRESVDAHMIHRPCASIWLRTKSGPHGDRDLNPTQRRLHVGVFNFLIRCVTAAIEMPVSSKISRIVQPFW